MYSYQPEPFSDEPTIENLLSFIQRQYRNIAFSLEDVLPRVVSPTHVEPSKPRDGQIIYAPGSEWDPGGGEGFYGYHGGVWNKLG